MGLWNRVYTRTYVCMCCVVYYSTEYRARLLYGNAVLDQTTQPAMEARTPPVCALVNCL